jgi:DNA-binding NtrC family response regulator
MSLGGVKIVIVDDEEMIRTMIGEILEDEGAEVRLFAGGNSALEYLSINEAHWLISDVNMPDGNGLDLIKNLHNLNLTTRPKILLLCGITDEVLDSQSLGIQKIFKKPDEAQEIIDYISSNER